MQSSSNTSVSSEMTEKSQGVPNLGEEASNLGEEASDLEVSYEVSDLDKQASNLDRGKKDDEEVPGMIDVTKSKDGSGGPQDRNLDRNNSEIQQLKKHGFLRPFGLTEERRRAILDASSRRVGFRPNKKSPVTKLRQTKPFNVPEFYSPSILWNPKGMLDRRVKNNTSPNCNKHPASLQLNKVISIRRSPTINVKLLPNLVEKCLSRKITPPDEKASVLAMNMDVQRSDNPELSACFTKITTPFQSMFMPFPKRITSKLESSGGLNGEELDLSLPAIAKELDKVTISKSELHVHAAEPDLSLPVKAKVSDKDIVSKTELREAEPDLSLPVKAKVSDKDIVSKTELREAEPDLSLPVKAKVSDTDIVSKTELREAEPDLSLPVKAKVSDTDIVSKTELREAEPDLSLPVKAKVSDKDIVSKTELREAEPDLSLPVKAKVSDEYIVSKTEHHEAEPDLSLPVKAKVSDEYIVSKTELHEAEPDLSLPVKAKVSDEYIVSKTELHEAEPDLSLPFKIKVSGVHIVSKSEHHEAEPDLSLPVKVKVSDKNIVSKTEKEKKIVDDLLKPMFFKMLDEVFTDPSLVKEFEQIEHPTVLKYKVPEVLQHSFKNPKELLLGVSIWPGKFGKFLINRAPDNPLPKLMSPTESEKESLTKYAKFMIPMRNYQYLKAVRKKGSQIPVRKKQNLSKSEENNDMIPCKNPKPLKSATDTEVTGDEQGLSRAVKQDLPAVNSIDVEKKTLPSRKLGRSKIPRLKPVSVSKSTGSACPDVDKQKEKNIRENLNTGTSDQELYKQKDKITRENSIPGPGTWELDKHYETVHREKFDTGQCNQKLEKKYKKVRGEDSITGKNKRTLDVTERAKKPIWDFSSESEGEKDELLKACEISRDFYRMNEANRIFGACGVTPGYNGENENEDIYGDCENMPGTSKEGTLTELGFTRNEAIYALKFKDYDVHKAAEWLLSGGAECELKKCRDRQSGCTRERFKQPEPVYEPTVEVKELVEIGFSTAQSVHALELTGYNVAKAADSLLNNPYIKKKKAKMNTFKKSFEKYLIKKPDLKITTNSMVSRIEQRVPPDGDDVKAAQPEITVELSSYLDSMVSRIEQRVPPDGDDVKAAQPEIPVESSSYLAEDDAETLNGIGAFYSCCDSASEVSLSLQSQMPKGDTNFLEEATRMLEEVIGIADRAVNVNSHNNPTSYIDEDIKDYTAAMDELLEEIEILNDDDNFEYSLDIDELLEDFADCTDDGNDDKIIDETTAENISEKENEGKKRSCFTSCCCIL